VSVPKQHHSVPRVYLENFVDSDGRLTIFSKRRSQTLRPKPSNALTRFHYFSQPVNGIENADQSFESGLLNNIETKFPDLLRSLQYKDQEIDIDILIETILSMAIRTPSFREPFEIGLADYVDRATKSLSITELPPPPPGLEDILDHIVVAIDPHRSLHAMNHYLKNYAGVLATLEYRVLFAPKGETILTSDNPIIWYESGYQKQRPSICRLLPTNKTRAVLPLSPKMVLVGRKSPTGDFSFSRNTRRLNRSEIREINEMQTACSWDYIIGTAKLPSVSKSRFLNVSPKYTISHYNPETNDFDISNVELAKHRGKHKFKRR
jgi:hypothetical protein